MHARLLLGWSAPRGACQAHTSVRTARVGRRTRRGHPPPCLSASNLPVHPLTVWHAQAPGVKEKEKKQLMKAASEPKKTTRWSMVGVHPYFPMLTL